MLHKYICTILIIIIIYNAHKAITKFLIGKIFVLFSYSIEYLLFVYIMNKIFYKL